MPKPMLDIPVSEEKTKPAFSVEERLARLEKVVYQNFPQPMDAVRKEIEQAKTPK